MEIKYSAFYINENGTRRVIHGKLTDQDIQEAVKQKEDRDDMQFESADFDSVEL